MPGRIRIFLATIAIQCGASLAAPLATASPTVAVTYRVDSGLAVWDVLVTPDAQLLAEGEGTTFLQLSVETNHPTAGPSHGADWDQPFSGNVISVPLTNPYTGIASHGTECYCSVTSRLGIEGHINSLYASLESVNLTSPKPSKALSFWTYAVNASPTLLKYSGLVVQGTDGDPVHFSGEFAFNPTARLRDANIDGEINNLDLDHMIVALTSPPAWEALHPGENILEFMDANFDGVVNNLDINNLFDSLDYPPADCSWPAASLHLSQVPEPSALVLAAVVGMALVVLRRGRTVLSPWYPTGHEA